MKKVISLILVCLVVFVGCAGTKISMVNPAIPLDHSVETIAMAPEGGLLADAIAIELSNYGFNVTDTGTTTKLMARLNLNEVEITKPQNLILLKDQGIDAYLSVKSAAGYDGLPQSASVRMNSTYNGKIIAGLSWQNGWGGQATSIADRMMRKDISEAASEITKALVKGIRK